MAKGMFLFFSSNAPLNATHTRPMAIGHEKPSLADLPYGYERKLAQQAEKILFFRDNGEVWLLKSRAVGGGVSGSVPRVLVAPYGYVPRKSTDPTMDDLACIEARVNSDYESVPLVQAIADALTLLNGYAVVRGRHWSADAKLKDAQTEIASLKSQVNHAVDRAIATENDLRAELRKTKEKLAEKEKALDNMTADRDGAKETIATLQKHAIATEDGLRAELKNVTTSRDGWARVSELLAIELNKDGRAPVTILGYGIVSVDDRQVKAPSPSKFPKQFPPKVGDVWYDTFRCNNWEVTGSPRSGAWTMKSPGGQVDVYPDDAFISRLRFVKRAKPRIFLKLNLSRDIALERGDDKTTKYNSFEIFKLVDHLVSDFVGKPVDVVNLKLLQATVDRWIDDQIARGLLFYDSTSDAWISK